MSLAEHGFIFYFHIVSGNLYSYHFGYNQLQGRHQFQGNTDYFVDSLISHILSPCTPIKFPMWLGPRNLQSLDKPKFQVLFKLLVTSYPKIFLQNHSHVSTTLLELNGNSKKTKLVFPLCLYSISHFPLFSHQTMIISRILTAQA